MKKESKILIALKNSQGFSLLELIVVGAILSVLTVMATVNYLDSRAKASDILALSDAKHIITVVTSNFFDEEDVDYDTGGGWATQIGTKRNDASARPAVHVLSPGVFAWAIGYSSPVQLGNITIYYDSIVRICHCLPGFFVPYF